MIQLKSSEIKALKEKWHIDQNYICPLIKQRVELDKSVLDHLHKLKAEKPSIETGKGLCRGVLHNSANQFEGKVTSIYKRLGLASLIELPDLLRNLADYLENNKYHQGEYYIHPTEKVKEPTLSKNSYNKLVKTINGKQKIPNYNKKLTKALQKLFTKYDVEPKFNKS